MSSVKNMILLFTTILINHIIKLWFQFLNTDFKLLGFNKEVLFNISVFNNRILCIAHSCCVC